MVNEGDGDSGLALGATTAYELNGPKAEVVGAREVVEGLAVGDSEVVVNVLVEEVVVGGEDEDGEGIGVTSAADEALVGKGSTTT